MLDLRPRVERRIAWLRLVVVLWKVSGFTLTSSRIPDQANRLRLLQAIDRAHVVFPLRIVLRVLDLSQFRYSTWKRADKCALEDVTASPRAAPQQLTAAERATIQDLVTSDEYCHVPTGTLALLAQQLGKVLASPTTWYRLV